MCRLHWFKVPKPIRDRIWAGYRAGMGEAYAEAINEGISAVVVKESKSKDRPGGSPDQEKRR